MPSYYCYRTLSLSLLPFLSPPIAVFLRFFCCQLFVSHFYFSFNFSFFRFSLLVCRFSMIRISSFLSISFLLSYLFFNITITSLFVLFSSSSCISLQSPLHLSFIFASLSLLVCFYFTFSVSFSHSSCIALPLSVFFVSTSFPFSLLSTLLLLVFFLVFSFSVIF